MVTKSTLICLTRMDSTTTSPALSLIHILAVYLNWQYARTGIGVDEEAAVSYTHLGQLKEVRVS